MKKTAITVAMLSLAAASSNALADGNETASVTLTHVVPLECNIGLLATGAYDSSLGEIAELSAGHNKILELNDISEKNPEHTISGAVKCNSNEGYNIDVSVANGGLLNSETGDTIAYELTAENKGGSNLNPVAGLLNLGAATKNSAVFSSVQNPAEQQFQLKFKTDPSDFDGAGSGHYTETITFSLVAL